MLFLEKIASETFKSTPNPLEKPSLCAMFRLHSPARLSGPLKAPTFFWSIKPKRAAASGESGLSTSREKEFEAALEPIVENCGFEVVDLEYQPRGKVLRVFIDEPPQSDLSELPPELTAKSSQITLEDCAEVDRAIGEWLEEDDRFPEGLTLEVSSPGVNRKIKKDRDFFRFRGEDVFVKAIRPLSSKECDTELDFGKKGRKQFHGTLLGLDEARERVLLQIDGKKVSVPREMVTRAQIDFDVSKMKFR
jgi:ribosome maturation factor RimP